MQNKVKSVEEEIADFEKAAAEEKRVVQAMIDKVVSQQEKCNREVFKLKENLSKNVSYGEFIQLMSRVSLESWGRVDRGDPQDLEEPVKKVPFAAVQGLVQ